MWKTKLIYPLLAIAYMLSAGFPANGSTYYLSSLIGDDSRTPVQAQNAVTPWKSLSKLNGYFNDLRPGDTVLFQRGSVFTGTLLVTQSGTAGHPIVLAAYGTGNDPSINGFSAPLTGWVSAGSGIWRTACPGCGPRVNMVAVGDSSQPMGRYPNAGDPNMGYSTIQQHAGTTTITDNNLGSGPDWTGGDLVIRKNRWVTERDSILSQKGNTIFYQTGSNFEPANKFGYFVQNHIKTLDKNGEWYYDPHSGQMNIYWTANPSGVSIKASEIDTLLIIIKKQYLVFDGILFQGSNMEGIYLLGASNITFTNCKIRFSGLDGIKGIQSNYIMIANTTVEYSNNNGIDLDGSRNTIQNSRIARSGAFPGMGNVSHSYQGITITGNNNTVQYNRVDTTGYSALVFTGVSNIIQNNLVDYFNFVKDDGGGIYTWSGDIDSATRRSTGLVTANIVLNGVTASAGTDNSVAGIAHGIYLDENTGVANVSGNTVAHCTAGIFIQDAHEITVSGNTFFDNTGQIIIRHSQVTGTLRNNEITNNIGVSRVDSQNVLVMSSIASVTSLPSFAYMHANKYAQISGNSSFFRTAMQDENNSGSLALWKSPRYNKDWNSVQLPVNIPSYIVGQLTGENLYKKGAIITPFSQAVNGNRVIVSTPVGAIQSGASYVAHFTLYSPDNTHTLLVFLQKYSPPYTHLTPVMNVTTGMPGTSNTIVMNTTGSDPDASIVFQMNQSDPRISIGNIDLYAADVTPYDPDQNVLFQYNASKSVLTIPLNGVYQDAGGQTYQGNVQLQPYASVLLIRNFTAQAPPSPCNIPYISTVKPLGGGSVNVTWDGVSGAASYNIKFVNGAYTKEFSNYVPAGSSPYSFNFSGLPASNYVISIQANCSSGQISAWGSYFSSVHINSVGGSIADVASKDTITVDKGDVFTLYPVPSSSQVNILYHAEQSGKADIIIMNELGSTLIRKTVGVTAGQNNYPINVSQFANGVYIVKLIAGNYIHVQKLVVRR